MHLSRYQVACVYVHADTFQFSLSAVLPGTFTLLSPNDLVFASEVVMLMLVFIAAISYAILERENLMAW